MREAGAGFDGSWVAHPDLGPMCDEIFTETLGERSNQLDVLRDDVAVSADDLLAVDRTPGTRPRPACVATSGTAPSTWSRGWPGTVSPRSTT